MPRGVLNARHLSFPYFLVLTTFKASKQKVLGLAVGVIAIVAGAVEDSTNDRTTIDSSCFLITFISPLCARV
jgi:hypothetical protein